jgi:hypothetical protein
MMARGTNTWLLLPALLSIATAAHGQRGGAAATGKASAPFDLTGYWVSIVTEDWRYRMVTPTPGDYQGVPMNLAARQVADAWDPAKDEAAGEQCKSYGAPALLRVPERLHITWEDDQTLREETDAGMQTRLFHFGDWKAPGGPRTWQGDSVARWETAGSRGGPPRSGSLRVTTTHLRAGYLRKNGVPYSEDATLTEYYDLAQERNGDVWLVVTIAVQDPKYLTQQFVISSQFKKQADGSGWDPTPCSSRW